MKKPIHPQGHHRVRLDLDGAYMLDVLTRKAGILTTLVYEGR